MLLADHEGVHEASAHLGVEGLLQTGKQPQVLLLVGLKGAHQEVLLPDEGAEPGEVVEDLQVGRETSALSPHRRVSGAGGATPHLDGRRAYELDDPVGPVHQGGEVRVVVLEPAAVDQRADDVGHGVVDRLGGVERLP